MQQWETGQSGSFVTFSKHFIQDPNFSKLNPDILIDCGFLAHTPTPNQYFVEQTVFEVLRDHYFGSGFADCLRYLFLQLNNLKLIDQTSKGIAAEILEGFLLSYLAFHKKGLKNNHFFNNLRNLAGTAFWKHFENTNIDFEEYEFRAVSFKPHILKDSFEIPENYVAKIQNQNFGGPDKAFILVSNKVKTKKVLVLIQDKYVIKMKKDDWVIARDSVWPFKSDRSKIHAEWITKNNIDYKVNSSAFERIICVVSSFVEFREEESKGAKFPDPGGYEKEQFFFYDFKSWKDFLFSEISDHGLNYDLSLKNIIAEFFDIEKE